MNARVGDVSLAFDAFFSAALGVTRAGDPLVPSCGHGLSCGLTFSIL